MVPVEAEGAGVEPARPVAGTDRLATGCRRLSAGPSMGGMPGLAPRPRRQPSFACHLRRTTFTAHTPLSALVFGPSRRPTRTYVPTPHPTWTRPGSNRRPLARHASALPTAPQVLITPDVGRNVEPTGIEPVTSAVPRRRATDCATAPRCCCCCEPRVGVEPTTCALRVRCATTAPARRDPSGDRTRLSALRTRHLDHWTMGPE